MANLKKYKLTGAFENSKSVVILQPSMRKFNLDELTDKEASEMLKLGFKHVEKLPAMKKEAEQS